MSISKDLDDGLLFGFILLVFMFILHFLFLRHYIEILSTILVYIVVMGIYFGYGKDVWKSKFKSRFIVGENIKTCFLPDKVVSVSDVLPNHILVFLESYREQSLGAEVIGEGGALFIDRNYFWVYSNNSIAISPEVIVKPLYSADKSKYNDCVRLVERYGGNSNKIYLACVKDMSKQILVDEDKNKYFDLDIQNIVTFINNLMHQKNFLASQLDNFGENVEDYMEKLESIIGVKKKFLGVPYGKKKIDVKKDEE